MVETWVTRFIKEKRLFGSSVRWVDLTDLYYVICCMEFNWKCQGGGDPECTEIDSFSLYFPEWLTI